MEMHETPNPIFQEYKEKKLIFFNILTLSTHGKNFSRQHFEIELTFMHNWNKLHEMSSPIS